VALAPHEIQFGILKRLRGAPIARHSEAHALRFNPDPPYNILATDVIDFATMQRLSRFARYWDIIANSGRYTRTLPRLLGATPFARFLAFSDWLYAGTGQTHALAHERLVHLLHDYLIEQLREDATASGEDLAADYHAAGGRSRLRFEAADVALPLPRAPRRGSTPERQARHLAGRS